MAESSTLKSLIDQKFISDLSHSVAKEDASFDTKNFKKNVFKTDFKNLELKQRLRRVTESLGPCFKNKYPQQISILKKIAPQFQGLASLIFPDFVEVYGLDHFKISVEALKFFTQYGSSEFAIRPFIKKYPEDMLPILIQWSKSSNHHVRRLASEGSRPRLPWSFKLDVVIKQPRLTAPILENLINDESLYVRKSVANHLNDISKDHPDLAFSFGKKWVNSSPHSKWIIKHGLRSLLKKGDQKTLKLFGQGQAEKIKIKNLSLKNLKNKIGANFEFNFAIANQHSKEQLLRVEYIIHFVKKSKADGKKIFKITEKIFTPGDHTLIKKHSIRQMSTRQHYPGLHRLEIVINGLTLAKTEFHLIK